MKLSDKAWRLNHHYGINESTVEDCTRGDSSCDEFFTTEREAWEAEAARCDREASRYERDAGQWRKRQSEAAHKAAALGKDGK